MTPFEPIVTNITIAIEELESLHIDWHAIWKKIYEARIKYACESKLCKRIIVEMSYYNFLLFYPANK